MTIGEIYLGSLFVLALCSGTLGTSLKGRRDLEIDDVENRQSTLLSTDEIASQHQGTATFAPSVTPFASISPTKALVSDNRIPTSRRTHSEISTPDQWRWFYGGIISTFFIVF